MISQTSASIQDLASRIDVSEDTIHSILININSHYRKFSVRRTRKRPRWINAPDPKLKTIQKKILQRVLYKAKPHPDAHGFYPGKSILSNARPHCKKNWVISFDVKDFFPSTTQDMVRKSLLHEKLAIDPNLISQLCCLDGALPQGAPTSPHLANLAFYECDLKLKSFALSHSLNYTRYADDMTFSGNEFPDQITESVRKTLLTSNYQLAEEKTKLMGRNTQQKVTGLHVNERVLLPRSLRRKIRAIRHDIKTNGITKAISKSTLVKSESELQGFFALEAMIEKA
ncbi:MAG: reverse transcriptase family protein [Verrucomicrobiota bacterium]|nr:reverse transcriptase family protein [Verrucomicrobiota bacterium]